MALQIPPNCDLTLGLTCVEKTVPGTTVWSMRVDERFLNPAGIIQGGFLAAMLDSAMGASAVTGAAAGRKVSVANTEMKVSFLRSAQLGDELTCTARDELVATASSSYLIRERSE